MNATGIPFMMTAGMKAALKARGFTSSEIHKMTPEQAHEHLAISLQSLADKPIWVAWKEEETRTGELTKVPKDPATDRNAQVPTNPKTWGTRAAAEKRWQEIQKAETDAKGGVGIVLGNELPNEIYLAGIDLDSCRGGEMLDLAEMVIDRFGTYTEISPSEKGMKLYFQMSAGDMGKLHELLGTNEKNEQLTRKTFSAGKHMEMAIDVARFYAVTGNDFEKHKDIRLVPFEDVEWFVKEIGPRYLSLFKKTNGHAADPFAAYGEQQSPDIDQSGSGYGFRFMADCHAHGLSEEQARTLILADKKEAGEWANRVNKRQLDRAWENSKPQEQSQANIDPVDLWANFTPPALPRKLLPKVIENFAFTMGETMGADPAGLAMAVLTVCGAAIDDGIKLQMKQHSDGWQESARLWAALVGLPSFKKSPAMIAAAKALRKRDHELLRQYQFELKTYKEMEAEERKSVELPLQKRLCLEDTTIEAAQEVLVGSPNGVLLYQDELSGFFGSMDKYSGSRGATKDRAFWLQSWSGGSYGLNRIGRGVSIIPNLSISLIGGIQPDVIRRISAESHDDGFLARMLMVMARPAVMGMDVPTLPVADTYAKLIDRLTELTPPTPFGNIPVSLCFDKGAQALRGELERKHLARAQQFELINKKLGAAIGKYDGYFGRLCLLWHCIEHANENKLPQVISEDTARRVAEFMEKFLLPHAVSFYCGVLGLADEHDRLASVAGYILAHRLEKVTNRDIQRGDRTMRGLTHRETDGVFEQLEALGWITRTPGPRQALHWIVNPNVHIRFAERATKEATQRAATRELIINQIRGGAHGS